MATPFARRRRSGSGALRPPPPVAAALVPRSALLPAAPPRDVLAAVGVPFRPIASEPGTYGSGEAPSCGGWGREGVRSEARAKQRLAPWGRGLPRSAARRAEWAALPLTRNESAAYFYVLASMWNWA